MRQTTVFLFVLSQGAGKRLLRGGETLTGVPGAVKGLEMQERKARLKKKLCRGWGQSWWRQVQLYSEAVLLISNTDSVGVDKYTHVRL